MTGNLTVFPPGRIPSELLALNVTAGLDPSVYEGYECEIERCSTTGPCNATVLQIGAPVAPWCPMHSHPVRLTRPRAWP